MSAKEQLEQLKAQAAAYCKSVGLDQAIRTLCKGDGSTSGSINRSVKIELPNGKTLDLRATWGADVNGAYARYVDSVEHGFHLYECSDYGRYLHGFQPGEWVGEVLKLAKTEAIAQEAAAQAAELRQLQDEIRKWLPAD